MSAHIERQFEKLKRQILAMGTRVEEAVARAITAVVERDGDLAERVIGDDNEIDLLEVDIEEECLKTLALHQPVAFDLRYVVAVLKINNDLERIGDLAVNVAEQACFLAGEAPLDRPPIDLPAMAQVAQIMLRKSLDALINVDVTLAGTVRRMDDEVDATHRQMYEVFTERVQDKPYEVPQMMHYLTISRQLERIADHSVNIAEDVMYRHEQARRQSQEPTGSA